MDTYKVELELKINPTVNDDPKDWDWQSLLELNEGESVKVIKSDMTASDDVPDEEGDTGAAQEAEV